MTDQTRQTAAETRITKRIAIGAIILSVAAIAFSAFVFFQLPEAVSLEELEVQVSDNAAEISDNAADISDNSRRIASTRTETFAALEQVSSNIGSALSQANDAQRTASEAQFAADDALDRAEEIAVDLGFCLFAEFEDYLYWYYWGGPNFQSGTEYVTHCEYR